MRTDSKEQGVRVSFAHYLGLVHGFFILLDVVGVLEVINRISRDLSSAS